MLIKNVCLIIAVSVKLQGCSILANMNQGQNNKGESQRFVQEAMGNIIRQDILTQAVDSPWYTIMVDETTDISVISEMTVYIRYIGAEQDCKTLIY